MGLLGRLPDAYEIEFMDGEKRIVECVGDVSNSYEGQWKTFNTKFEELDFIDPVDGSKELIRREICLFPAINIRCMTAIYSEETEDK